MLGGFFSFEDLPMTRKQKKDRAKALKQALKETHKARKLGADEPVAEVSPSTRAIVEATARAAFEDVRTMAREARELDDTRARGMLVRAAEFLDDMIHMTREALDNFTPEQKREAFVAMRAPEPSDPKQPKRSRANPVLALMRLGAQVSRLLQQILARTNPELGKPARAT